MAKGSRGGQGQSTTTGGLASVLRLFSSQGGNSKGRAQFGAVRVPSQQAVGDYTDDDNPELLKWQSQTDDKAANFLAKVDKTTDLSQIQQNTNDPWAFYDNPQQKLVLALGLNKPPTVLSRADFNNYVNQTGAQVIYRGWSGQNAVDRFEQSPNSHIGNGINGDGYYFAPNRGTASGYGPVVTRAALSPTARVVDVSTVRSAIRQASPKLQSALQKAGSYGTRTYGGNNGEAQMALKMGYNCIDAGWAIIPLTRDAVVISK